MTTCSDTFVEESRQLHETTGKVAAFFDLDRTLILENSAKLYILYERRHRRMSLTNMMQASLYLVLYHFSLVDIESAYRRATVSLTGASPEVLQARTAKWFQEEIASLLLPGAKAALQYHREQGHPCVLLTGSTEFLAREVTKAWPLDDWLANCFAVGDDGLLTGEVSSPLCYAAGKVHWAEDWASRNEVDVSRSYFYTDSLTDRAMLEHVAHPRVVNPDPNLRRLARQQSWPIFDWRQEEGAVIP